MSARKTYTCAGCGRTFPFNEERDVEARREAREAHPNVPIEDMAIVCNDCHQAHAAEFPS